MRMTRLNSLLALAFVAAASTAVAQPFYLAGSLTNPAWSPGPTMGGKPIGSGVVADTLMTATATGLTITLTSAQHGLTPGTEYEYKFSEDNWGANFPGNQKLNGPAAGLPLTITYRTTAFGDGFLPEPNGTNPGGFALASSSVEAIASATSINLIGTLSSELGAAADWTANDPGNPVLTDAGNGTLGDGILGLTTTALPAATYEFKFVINNDFVNGDFGTGGFKGGNISFTCAAGASVDIQFRTADGRYKVTVGNPPGYYASFDGTGTTFAPAEKLDQVGPNLYAKTFTIATAGAHVARVTKEDNTNYPTNASPTARAGAGSGYPFVTTAAGQSVRVYLDRNTYADGFKPEKDFVAVVADDASHSILNTFTQVYVVGGPQGEFLAGDTGGGTEWLPNEFGMALTGGGEVVSYTATPLAANTNQEWKVLARSADFPAATGWDSIEVGTQGLSVGIGAGANQAGISFTTSSSYTFTADLKTGRVAHVAGAVAPTPTRPSYLTSNTAVQDWSLF